MTDITLSNAQQRVLEATASQPEKPAETFAGFLPSGAQGKVIAALHHKGLLEKRGNGHHITEAGFAALGREPTEAPAQPEERAAEPAQEKPKRVTKQDTMIAMLEQGTTLKGLMEATGWQKHSVHGAMANLKKKQKLTISQSKTEGEERVYKIA